MFFFRALTFAITSAIYNLNQFAPHISVNYVSCASFFLNFEVNLLWLTATPRWHAARMRLVRFTPWMVRRFSDLDGSDMFRLSPNVSIFLLFWLLTSLVILSNLLSWDRPGCPSTWCSHYYSRDDPTRPFFLCQDLLCLKNARKVCRTKMLQVSMNYPEAIPGGKYLD